MNAELKKLLETLDVPEKRKEDLPWLRRNLPINNMDKPGFKRAMFLVLGESTEPDNRGGW